MYIIPAYIIIGNAFYSTKSEFLSYEDIYDYRTFLHKNLSNEYRFIFDDDFKEVINIDNNLFIKENDGIYCHTASNLDNLFLKKLNLSYPENIQSIFKKTNTEFTSKIDILREKREKLKENKEKRITKRKTRHQKKY